MTPERLERTQCIAEAVIQEVFDDIVFAEVLVVPDPERYDDEDDLEYIEVRAIYEGERERLRRRSSKLRHVLRERLLDEGITEFPIVFMTKKSEWDRHHDPA